MGFVLGSDAGLKGLPGTIISGDSGWIGTGEVVWTVWNDGNRSVQLIPFIGMGGVQTDIDGVSFSDNLGSGGLIGRYRQGQWLVELGWVDTFNTDDTPGLWNDWLLGHGLYTKLKFSF